MQMQKRYQTKFVEVWDLFNGCKYRKNPKKWTNQKYYLITT